MDCHSLVQDAIDCKGLFHGTLIENITHTILEKILATLHVYFTLTGRTHSHLFRPRYYESFLCIHKEVKYKLCKWIKVCLKFLFTQSQQRSHFSMKYHLQGHQESGSAMFLKMTPRYCVGDFIPSC